MALSPIALELWPKMSFFVDFGQKIGHFDLVTIATRGPISVLLLICSHSHTGDLMSAFKELYALVTLRRTSKTVIFAENYATKKLQRPISRKPLEIGRFTPHR